MSLGDFGEFKELMIAHKKTKILEKSGGSELLTVFGTHMTSTSTEAEAINSEISK